MAVEAYLLTGRRLIRGVPIWAVAESKRVVPNGLGRRRAQLVVAARKGYFKRARRGPVLSLRKLTLPVFIALAAIGIAARLILLVQPGAPKIDVLYYDTQAVDALLHWTNPYGHAYAVPPSLATPGASTVFAYLPGVFAFLFPAGVISDVRLGLVAADMLIAASLFSIGGRYGRLCAAVFLLLPPTVLFSTWFPSDSIPSIALFSGAVAMEVNGKKRASATLWGLSVATGQLIWLLYPLFIVRSVKLGRARDIIVSICVAAAVIVPFLLWSPSTFVYDTVLFQFQREAVKLVSQGPFGVNINPSLEGIALSLGLSVPVAVRAAATALALIGASRLVHGNQGSLLKASTAFSALALFLLPEELFVSYLEVPLVTFLLWVAVTYHGGASEEVHMPNEPLKT